MTTERKLSGNSSTYVVFCAIMRKLPAFFAVLLTLTACDDTAPCAADSAAEASTSDGDGSSGSDGSSEGEPVPACVEHLGQCWCEGEKVAFTPADDAGCYCGAQPVDGALCAPKTCTADVATNGDQYCSCAGNEFIGAPHFDEVAGSEVCLCGQTPTVAVFDGGSCICGPGMGVDLSFCMKWDGFACFLGEEEVDPVVVDGVCACGLTPLDPGLCETG